MAPGRLPRILYFSKNKIKSVEGFFFPGERRKRKPAATTTTSVIFSNKRPEIREGERRRMLTNLLALLLSTLPVWEHRVKGTPSTLGVSVTTSGYNNRIPQSLDSFGGENLLLPRPHSRSRHQVWSFRHCKWKSNFLGENVWQGFNTPTVGGVECHLGYVFTRPFHDVLSESWVLHLWIFGKCSSV